MLKTNRAFLPAKAQAKVLGRPIVLSRASVCHSTQSSSSRSFPDDGHHTRRSSLALLGGALISLPLLLQAEPARAGLAAYNVNPSNKIEEVNVSLGTADNAMVFDPPNLEFIQGKVYKLHMYNPSMVTHYFTALEFADKIYTILVETPSPAIEVKGKVQEVALKAGASLTWMFVPIKPGTYPLRCPVKGHTEAGMVGTITIKPAAA